MIAWTTSSIRRVSMSVTTTLAPCAARSFAQASPMPEAAPVTSATLSLRSAMWFSCRVSAGPGRTARRSQSVRKRRGPRGVARAPPAVPPLAPDGGSALGVLGLLGVVRLAQRGGVRLLGGLLLAHHLGQELGHLLGHAGRGLRVLPGDE